LHVVTKVSVAEFIPLLPFSLRLLTLFIPVLDQDEILSAHCQIKHYVDHLWSKWGNGFPEARYVNAIRNQCIKTEDDFGEREEEWIRERIEQLVFGESVECIHIISITTSVTLMLLVPSLNKGSTLDKEAKVLVSQSNRGNHQIARIVTCNNPSFVVMFDVGPRVVHKVDVSQIQIKEKRERSPTKPYKDENYWKTNPSIKKRKSK
jgi:hypothetical protein